MSDAVIIQSRFTWLIEVEAGPARARQRVRFSGGADTLAECIRDYEAMATKARAEAGVGQEMGP